MNKDLKPVVEISKPSEIEFKDDLIVWKTKHFEITSNNEYVFKKPKVFVMSYNNNANDRKKEFMISVKEVDKSGKEQYKTNKFTISILSNLDNQNVIFKKFQFVNDEDVIGW